MAKYIENYACSHCYGSSGLCKKCKDALLAQGIEHEPPHVPLKKCTCDPMDKAALGHMTTCPCYVEKPETLPDKMSFLVETHKQSPGDKAVLEYLSLKDISSKKGDGIPTADVLLSMLGHGSTGKSLTSMMLAGKMLGHGTGTGKSMTSMTTTKVRAKPKLVHKPFKEGDMGKQVLDYMTQENFAEEGMTEIQKAVMDLVNGGKPISYDSVMKASGASGSSSGKSSSNKPSMQTVPKGSKLLGMDVVVAPDANGVTIVGDGQSQSFSFGSDKLYDGHEAMISFGWWGTHALNMHKVEPEGNAAFEDYDSAYAECQVIRDDAQGSEQDVICACDIQLEIEHNGLLKPADAEWAQTKGREIALRGGVPDFTND